MRVAISNSGYKFPTKRVIVNLAPANLRKEGPAFDLPIALGILAASGILAPGGLERAGVLGELSLDGGVRGIKVALSMAEGAMREGLERLVLPERDASEAAVIGGVEVFGLRTLRESVDLLAGSTPFAPAEPAPEDGGEVDGKEGLADVAGQRYAKRALEVATGGHNFVMSGPLGSGKTMLARRMPGILPPLTMEERIELRKVDPLSRRIRLRAQKTERARDELVQKLGRAPTESELVGSLGISVTEHRAFLDQYAWAQVWSLEAWQEGPVGGLHDLIGDRSATDPASAAEVAEVRARLVQATESLGEKERVVTTFYYFEGLTLREIGRVLDLTEGSISQILHAALARLRHNPSEEPRVSERAACDR